MRELSWDAIMACGGRGRPPFDDDRCLPFPSDPEVKVRREAVFLEGVFDEDEKGIFVAPTPVGTVKVRVNSNYRVVHKQPYGGGDVFDAPDDSTTEQWIQAGWVTPLPAPKKAKEITE